MTERDPIEEFFAHERAKLTALPADEERWQQIVLINRRTKRARTWRYAVGAAAAVSLIATVGWSLRMLPDRDGHQVASTQSTQATHNDHRTTPTSPPPDGKSTPGTSDPGQTHTPGSAASSQPVTMPVPSDFKVVSVSNAGSNTLFALGTTSCRGVACPAVARSTDNGKTWLQTATLTHADTPGRAPMGQVGTDNSFTQIRMVSPSVGFVFGGSIYKTTNAGLSFEPYKHDGTAVLDLAASNGQIVMTASTGSCDGSRCDGDVLIERAGMNDPAATTVTTVPGGDAITSAPVTWWQGTAFISPQFVGKKGTPVMLGAGGPQDVPIVCKSPEATPEIFAAGSGSTLFAACPASGDKQNVTFSLHTSKDDGMTWSGDVAKNLTLVNAGMSSFTAADDTHLLAASGGSPNSHGDMLVAASGPTSWTAPKAAPPLPDRGWLWVGAPGAGMYYAIPVDGFRGFYMSPDRGQTWERVTTG